jgi:hypothetical protein
MGLTQRLGTIPLAIQTDSSNNVGIGGAANASYKLAVTGASLFSSSINSGQIQATASGAVIQLIGQVGSNAYYVNDQVNNSGKRWRFGHTGAVSGYNSFDFYNQTDDRLVMTLTSTGNVGIGTSTPTGLLDVANRGITKGSMPSGSVIQVVTYQLNSGASTSGSTDIDTGLNASITPTSSTSKILVIVSANLRAQGTGGNTYVYGKIWRGAVGSGTSIYDGFAMMGNYASSDIRGIGNATILDSPATTSSVTYRFSINSQFANTASLNSTTSPSTITLMEIAQ